jgi:hypothetical protein
MSDDARAFWATRCATCRLYRETMAFGVGAGACGRTGETVAETDGCKDHQR